jgi:CheY-like chemotaxis protein
MRLDSLMELAMVAAPMRVFVVDDDADTTECMSLLLKHYGHEVRVANRGWTAIEQAPVFKPDLMLVDLAMPQVDGLAVARQLRSRPELASMALVAVTGYADAAHRQQALEAGFDECLVKPLPLNNLLELLVRVRERVAASQQRAAQAVETAAESRRRTQESRSVLADQANRPLDGQMPSAVIHIRKSGISEIITLEDRGAAEHLRGWLRERGCRVGPVFEPEPGQAAFFTYSRQQMRALLAAHPKLEINES